MSSLCHTHSHVQKIANQTLILGARYSTSSTNALSYPVCLFAADAALHLLLLFLKFSFTVAETFQLHCYISVCGVWDFGKSEFFSLIKAKKDMLLQ